LILLFMQAQYLWTIGSVTFLASLLSIMHWAIHLMSSESARAAPDGRTTAAAKAIAAIGRFMMFPGLMPRTCGGAKLSRVVSAGKPERPINVNSAARFKFSPLQSLLVRARRGHATPVPYSRLIISTQFVPGCSHLSLTIAA